MALSTASVQTVSWRFSGPFMIEWYSGDHTVNRRLSNEIRNRAGSLTVCELNSWDIRRPAAVHQVSATPDKRWRPVPSDSKCQEHVVQFTFRIGGRAIPGAFLPDQVVQVCSGASVHAGAQINEAFGTVDQRSENVRSKRVDHENTRKALFSGTVSLAKADSGIVDHGVEDAEPVRLLSDDAGAGDAREIPDNDCASLWQCPARVVGPGLIARMQNDLVPLFDQQLAGHEAETGGRSSDEYA
jgi:hypothetical protein